MLRIKQILSTRLLLLKHIHICALRDLVPFLKFKKREKHTRRSVNFSKVLGLSLQLY